jgi:hypothetical protein
MTMRGVEIWFISGLKTKQLVAKYALALFGDCQGEVLRIDKGDA